MNITKSTVVSIQLVRALAALSVVWLHGVLPRNCSLPIIGNFGVDISFVISGFIIAHMLQKSTKKFFIKRICRIVPLYALITIVLFTSRLILAEYIQLDLFYTVSDIPYLLKSLFFIPVSEGVPVPGNPILHVGWTLNYEMFFYFITFLCILFVRNKKYIALVCAIILCVWTIVLNLINTDNNFILNFYKYGHWYSVHDFGFTGVNLWLELVYGIVLHYCYSYVTQKEWDRKVNQKLKVVLCLIVALISYSLMIYSKLEHFWFTSERAIVYGIPSLTLVASILFLEQNLRSKINNKIVQFGLLMGEISYAIYLLHSHVIRGIDITLWRLIPLNIAILPLEIVRIIVIFAFVIFASIVVRKYIDTPIQQYLRIKLKS